jgi:ADP-ribosylglycohydrolase
MMIGEIMKLPKRYIEQVYSGILGKIIGVYLGRPFEGWSYEKIMAELGEINYYVHEQRAVNLIVPDDDIAGTFTFLRALPDYNHKANLSPADIAQSWLNYIIERRTILWWGGLGNSTEHTAFLRLKHGIPAPQSGSIELNGKTVAEQIGAQIFIDGWAMVCPGDPERAVDLARRAGSVSHDGEAIYGAQVIAAMESQAFVEHDLNQLIDIALALIPKKSIIYCLINDLLQWRAAEPDWHKTRQKIVQQYGYETYGGNCHVVPNQALIFLGLLYGDDQFQKTLMITNTAGWDTDCNSGNVGCLMGIKNGLTGLDCGPDWRGPVADRMYISAADGGRAITDAVTETYQVVNIGRALTGQPRLAPKNGARFHFELPGSLQGFMADEAYESRNTLRLENEAGHSECGSRSLAFHYQGLAPGRVARAKTITFIPLEAKDFSHYELIASPTLYQGQKIHAGLCADAQNNTPVSARLYLSVYNQTDQYRRIYGPRTVFPAGAAYKLDWQVEGTGGQPVVEIGLEISAEEPATGVIYVDFLGWDGVPEMCFQRPVDGGSMWRRAWVNAVDTWDAFWPETYRIVQNEGRGLIMQGCREWDLYRFEADIKPHMLQAAGVAVHVQGLQRYYALLLQRGAKIQLVKLLDGEQVLAETKLDWVLEQTYRLSLEADGAHIKAFIDGQVVFDVVDTDRPLLSGAVALVCQEGRMSAEQVKIRPVA